MKVEAARQKYRDARNQVIELSMQNKNARSLCTLCTKLNPLTIEFMSNLGDLTDYYSTLSEKTNVDNQAAFEKAMQITVGILVIAFIILGMSGWYMPKS
jgi:methyl-accepting chemotaxis protein